jgi:hypothetical protein
MGTRDMISLATLHSMRWRKLHHWFLGLDMPWVNPLQPPSMEIVPQKLLGGIDMQGCNTLFSQKNKTLEIIYLDK